MSEPRIRELLDQLDASSALTAAMREELRTLLFPPPPPQTVGTEVRAGGDLQAALDKGGLVRIVDPGLTFERGRFVVSKSGTTLLGNGAQLRGTTGPALFVPPGVHQVSIDAVTGSSPFDAVFLLGENVRERQSTLDVVPTDVVLTRCLVPTHRNKRAFEINARQVKLLDCEAADVWISGTDNQAISIMNTPGDVLVAGGQFSAGAEVIMVGGDTMKLPAGTVPANLTFQHCRLWRPTAWMADGINRQVKNLFELKSSDGVLVQHVLMETHWAAAQPGWPIVLTPRNGLGVRHVWFDQLTLRNCGAGFNILGRNDNGTPTPWATTGLRITNSTITIDDATYPGTGVPFQLLAGGLATDPQPRLGTLDVEDSTIVGGNYYGRLVTGDLKRTLSDGSIVRHQVERVSFVNNAITNPMYPARGCVHMPEENPPAYIRDLRLVGNRIAGASTVTRERYPDNFWVE